MAYQWFRGPLLIAAGLLILGFCRRADRLDPLAPRDYGWRHQTKMKRMTALNAGAWAVIALLLAFGVYAIGWPEPILMRYPHALGVVGGSGSIPLSETGVRWMGAISIALALALFWFSRGGRNEAK